jgi:hypothetical protein
MAQAVAIPTITGLLRKHLRVQEQPLLTDGELDARRGWPGMRAADTVIVLALRLLSTFLNFWLIPSSYGATTSFGFDFTCTAERLEASQPPPRALTRSTLVTSRCP